MSDRKISDWENSCGLADKKNRYTAIQLRSIKLNLLMQRAGCKPKNRATASETQKIASNTNSIDKSCKNSHIHTAQMKDIRGYFFSFKFYSTYALRELWMKSIEMLTTKIEWMMTVMRSRVYRNIYRWNSWSDACIFAFDLLI